eukprot:TRINITY_DN8263_c0_g2_i1.p1 TRINITY_DN8263_c0_g2~~TRINITY_DN8263_c0_g2_i1.p1  ORF type:complete len:383 (+),score=101.12 TRINITY_DN8263_c0_g2_i1:597-1745(+)
MTSSSAGSLPLAKGVVKEREMPISVSNFYIHVVDHVIKTLRPEFQAEGLEDSVLNDIQSLWESKLMQRGAIQGPIDRSVNPATRGTNGPITPVHDLNVPYEPTEEYQTPTAEMLFPPTPAMETPMQTPLPGNTEPVMYQYFPPGPGQTTMYPPSAVDAEAKIGRPAPYMPDATWVTQKPVLDVNVAYQEDGDEGAEGIGQPVTKDFFNFTGGKRKREEQPSNYLQGGGYIPQQDGAGELDSCCENEDEFTNKNQVQNLSADRKSHASDALLSALPPGKLRSKNILQVDGTDDNHDMSVKAAVEEDYNESAEQEDEEPLNDNDDDPDDVDQIDGDSRTDDLVLAQFEKVSRTKNRWKCTLKDGVMHLNNRDILFSKATGEFEF